jgi:hypothetical protein
MDNEIKGEGNSINYKYRMHDPRVGRFFATDPLTHKYPWYSPYSFSGNKVIHRVELEGLEDAKFGTTLYDANLQNITAEELEAYHQGQTGALLFGVYVALEVFVTHGAISAGLAGGDFYEATNKSEEAVQAERNGDFQKAAALRNEVGELSKSMIYEGLGGAAAYGLGKVIQAASKLNASGSKLVSSAMLEDTAKNYPSSTTYGNPAETFIAPAKEIDDLLSQGLSRSEIANKLGINDPKFLEGDLIRIDIDNTLAKELNIREPTGSEVGANDSFIPGGQTSGGVTEKVVDGIPQKDIRVKVTKVKE